MAASPRVAAAAKAVSVFVFVMAEPKATGDTLEVTGGAFRSRKKWYALSYRCTSTPDRMSVVAFHFTIGAEIPEEKWSSYGLWD